MRRVLTTLTLVALGATACSRPPEPATGQTSGRLEAPGDRARAVATPAPLADGLFTPEEVRELVKMAPPDGLPKDPTNEVSGDPRAVALGQRLFFDRGLSSNGKVSCASCHDPDGAFTTSSRLGQGVGSVTTPRHPPSILNAAWSPWLDWDGKADSLWMQAMRPLESDIEHGVTRMEIARRVLSEPSLRVAYVELFGPAPDLSDTSRFPPRAMPGPEGSNEPAHTTWAAMTPEDRATVDAVFVRATKAIAAYEERLVSTGSPLDRYVVALRDRTDEGLDALTPQQKEGLKVYLNQGRCITCHNGPMLSDFAFHNLGLGPRDWAPDPDEGRWLGVPEVKSSPFNAAGPHSADPNGERADWVTYLRRTPEDHGQFRTPSLRNVSRTAPYMHAGHFETLDAVVSFYQHLDEPVLLGHREDALVPAPISFEMRQALVALMNGAMDSPMPPAELLKDPYAE